MAIKFEFYESPNTIGTRKKRYHARVVNWQRINTDYLAREIQYGSSLTVADIKATIISLSEKLAYYLKDGALSALKVKKARAEERRRIRDGEGKNKAGKRRTKK